MRAGSATDRSNRPRTWDWALVTGASSGIGRAIVERLAAEGVNVVLVARRAEKLAEVAASVQEQHRVRTEIIVADLADQSQRDAVEARLGAEHNAIDLLVNSAGGGLVGTLITHSVQQRTYETELNCVSVLRLCHAAAAAMTRRGRGTILNVASGLGYYPCPGAATYCASKAFVLNLSATLRYELRGTGVGVTVVSPGPTDTDAAALAGMDLTWIPRFLVTRAARVAEVAIAAAKCGRAVEQVNAWNAALTLTHHAPARFSQPLLGRIFRRVTQRVD
jgi:short-subunit dehydrogenase